VSERVWFWIEVYAVVTFVVPTLVILIYAAGLPIWGPRSRK
jgi:hypothetical protein